MEKKTSGKQSASRFPVEAAATLLIALVIIDLGSLAGLVSVFPSSLPYPLGDILSSAFVVLGLLGAFGLLRNNVIGAHFALVSSVLQVVLASLSVYGGLTASPSNLDLVFSSIVVLALGFLAIVWVFKIKYDEHGMTETVPVDQSLLNFSRQPDLGSEYALEIVDVTKRYFFGSNTLPAINGVNMKVRKGEFLAIMGPSGSGKSTLLNLMGALDKPSSGRVLIDGVDISTYDDTGLARLRNEKIGFVFQAYNLIARSTVLSNMELPALVKGYHKDERLRRINDILAIVGLDDKALRKPKTLSGGEQQRVAVARALVNDPEIVLADEPTGNVDSKTGQVIMGFLRKLNLGRGTTVIVVTHNSEVAKMADKVLYVRDGKVVKQEIMGGLSK